jgi:integrase
VRIEKRITKDGSEHWRCLIRRRGSPRLSRTFSHRSDAEQWGIEQERRILRERAGLSAPATRDTVGELVDRYLEHVKNQPDHAEDTSRDRKRHLEWWKDRVGDTPAAVLRPRHIKLALLELKRTVTDAKGKEREVVASPATRNRYLSSLSVLYRWAMVQELLETNPALLVPRARERSHVIRWLTEDERTGLLAASEAQGALLHALVLVSLWTGGRQGETLRLRWRDVEREGEGKGGLVHYPSTKGGRPRAVPAPAEVFNALGKLKQGAPGALIFGGQKYWPRRAWRNALKASRVERFRWHDLRHSFCSWLVQRGVPIADVQQLAGHRAIQTTLRYAHLAPSDTHVRVRAALSQRDASAAPVPAAVAEPRPDAPDRSAPTARP